MDETCGGSVEADLARGRRSFIHVGLETRSVIDVDHVAFS
jgi:hypothetical protein